MEVITEKWMALLFSSYWTYAAYPEDRLIFFFKYAVTWYYIIQYKWIKSFWVYTKNWVSAGRGESSFVNKGDDSFSFPSIQMVLDFILVFCVTVYGRHPLRPFHCVIDPYRVLVLVCLQSLNVTFSWDSQLMDEQLWFLPLRLTARRLYIIYWTCSLLCNPPL